MTYQEFEALTTPENLSLVEQYIDQPTEKAAFAVRNAPLVSWIKNLQKSRKKLPSYYAARCFISSIGFQQSSSESTAMAKEFAGSGRACALAVDLTCGLGVDSFALSKVFDRVISVEVDQLRASIARYNFERLGVSNIEVVCCKAEDFVFPAAVDLIYIDPSREDPSGHRVYSLEQSSPDITKLMPSLVQNAKGVMVKLSPMYDVGEAFSVFGDVEVEVVSLDGECKEVIIKKNIGDPNTLQCTVVRGHQIKRIAFPKDQIGDCGVSHNVDIDAQRYLHLPDVAFYKSRTVGAYAISLNNVNCLGGASGVSVVGGYLFSVDKVDIIGQSYRIDRVEKYHPKSLKKLLKSMSVSRANIHLRDFPYPCEKVASALCLGLGGAQELFFTQYREQLLVFFVSLHTQETLIKDN